MCDIQLQKLKALFHYVEEIIIWISQQTMVIICLVCCSFVVEGLLLAEIVLLLPGDCGERVWLAVVATCGDGGGFAIGRCGRLLVTVAVTQCYWLLLKWVGLSGKLDR